MAVRRRGHSRARVKRKNYRIDVAKLGRAQREAALARALRDFVLEGGGHIEDIDARRGPPLSTLR